MSIQAAIPLAIREADWLNPQDQHQLQNIREQVFLREQNISEADEWDGCDKLNITKHFLAFSSTKLDLPVTPAIACIRVLAEGGENSKLWKIGRVAVLQNYRRKKVAQYFLNCVMTVAKEQNIQELILESQCYVTSLYEKLGFKVCSEPFLDAGIEHVKMQLKL